ncbi:MAG: DNA repair protein RecO [Alphaproteobacteria bacterium]
MQEWKDEAFLLSTRPLGESGVVARVLSRHHGHHAGLVHGGQAKYWRGWLQPGTRLDVSWRARLSDQLGHFIIDPMSAHAARIMPDPDKLAALSAALALLDNSLADRDPHPETFDCLEALLVKLEAAPTANEWGTAYLDWECRLLSSLGYGLPHECFANNHGYLDLENWTVVAYHTTPRPCLQLPSLLKTFAQSPKQKNTASRHDLGEALAFLATLLAVRVFRPLDRDLPHARHNLLRRFGVGMAEI